MILNYMKEGSLYVDGGARGNPGPAGAGGVLFDSADKKIGEFKKYLGDELTNNQAEYQGLILGLKLAQKNKIKKLSIFMDSELIVKQIKGEYRVKNEGLKPLFEKAKKLLVKFSDYNINHIVRERNKLADALVNEAIDMKK